MTTARDLVTLALKEAGVLGIGQSANSEDINDGFTLLSRLMAQWQKRRWLVPGLTTVSAVANGSISNAIGPGQHYNSLRPDKILSAYFVQVSQDDADEQVSYPLFPIFSREDYDLISLKDLNTWPYRFFYDGMYPNGNVFIWPIASSDYRVHLTFPMPIGFKTKISEGEIVNDGSAYTNGAYLAVALTGGTGTGATANITVAGNQITVVEIANGGQGYRINDFLSVAAASVGGTGTGFSYKVTNTTSNLDSEFNMPEEYEEAIHYNLAIRMCSMYQRPASAECKALAKVSLNTIRVANAQIPTLKMPAALQRNSGGLSIYNPDGY